MERNWHKKVNEPNERALKKSIVSVYETGAFHKLLKDVLHPGSLKLTRRLAEMAGVGSACRVLDVACAKGSTAIFLRDEYGCHVIGLDLSKDLTMAARTRSASSRGDQVHFLVADAEETPFGNNRFDIVISECSFSLLTHKKKAAQEMHRVLKPGGTLAMADICLIPTAESRQRPLESSSFAPFLCLSGAMSMDGYLSILAEAGFRRPHVEDHSWALKGMAFQVGVQFGGWKGFLKELSSELMGCRHIHEKPDNPIKDCQWAFPRGTLGYMLFSFTNSEEL